MKIFYKKKALLILTAMIFGVFVIALKSKAIAKEKKDDSGISVVTYKYDDPVKPFTMQVPADWKVTKNQFGYALFLEPNEKQQPTPENPVVADPNITVSVVRNPIVIDEQSLQQYESEIKTRFIAANGNSELNVFQKNLVDLPGNKKGLLYYLTYRRNGFDVVSAVLVMSNEKSMYRVTLTDYKVGFDKNLEKLFPVMASLKVEGKSLQRVEMWQQLLPYLLLAAVLVVVVLALLYFRSKNQQKILGNGGSSRARARLEELEGDFVTRAEGRTGHKRVKNKDSLYPESNHVLSGSPQSLAGQSLAPKTGNSVLPKSVPHSEITSSVPMSTAASSVVGSSAPQSVMASPVSGFQVSEGPQSKPLSVAFANHSSVGSTPPNSLVAHSEFSASETPTYPTSGFAQGSSQPESVTATGNHGSLESGALPPISEMELNGLSKPTLKKK